MKRRRTSGSGERNIAQAQARQAQSLQASARVGPLEGLCVNVNKRSAEPSVLPSYFAVTNIISAMDLLYEREEIYV
jgi:hypothetical protein